MIRRALFIVVTCLFGSQLLAQNIPDSNAIIKELKFINYLIGKQNHEDALFLLKKLHPSKIPFQNLRDSIFYLSGWSDYSLKNLDSSTSSFLNVSSLSSMYLKSRLFASYNQIFIGNYPKDILILNTLPENPQWCKETADFEKAGLSLLQRNYAQFESCRKNFTGVVFAMSDQEQYLQTYAKKLIDFHPKSMWKAGILSALVPGLGKIYTGNKGEGIVTFLIISTLGAITFENYHIDGLKDFKTIFFGTAFSVYYIGNIWGSAFAAQRHNQRFYYEMDQHILFDLHIPLRNLFD